MIYAGFWRRFAAVLIDSLILLIPSLIFHMIIPFLGGILVTLLYRPFFESSEIMGTPGKIFMGLQVKTETGERLNFKQALIRYFLSLVSGMFLCIGYLFNLFTPKRQTFHDMMVGSVVVESPISPEIDWFGVWSREFKSVFNMNGPDSIWASSSTSSSSSSSGPSDSTSSHESEESSLAMQKLDQLYKLYQQGALSESEYNAKKEELLKKI